MKKIGGQKCIVEVRKQDHGLKQKLEHRKIKIQRQSCFLLPSTLDRERNILSISFLIASNSLFSRKTNNMNPTLYRWFLFEIIYVPFNHTGNFIQWFYSQVYSIPSRFFFLLTNAQAFSLTTEIVGNAVNQNVHLCIPMSLLEKWTRLNL